ncbi:ABC transporter ATP-binding protein [Nonomuraea sp. NPDC000554]|uniref:ABC transporter ATP-binding protein n=1 Tax=Nonomuraea sp. NPDC000554 TaxID=3154259 RepID=UPI003318DD36
MAEQSALAVSHLGKRYRKVWALRDCTLSIPVGRTVALVGPNGAGKSTFMNMVVGLSKPTTGDIEIFGSRMRQDGPSLARVGFLAQDKPLYESFKVSEMLTFGRKLNPSWDQALAEDRLARLNIPLDRKVKALSGGQRTQVALTLAVAKRPDLLVLDEPLADLDPLAREELLQNLGEVSADSGITVIFSSHIVEDLADTCDWLVVLNRGRVQLSGAIDDVLAGHRLLTGPVDHAGQVVADTDVIADRRRNGEASLIVRTGASAVPEGWRVDPVALEPLVLGYLRRPESGRPAEQATMSGGQA